jgi:hypothetical protein
VKDNSSGASPAGSWAWDDNEGAVPAARQPTADAGEMPDAAARAAAGCVHRPSSSAGEGSPHCQPAMLSESGWAACQDQLGRLAARGHGLGVPRDGARAELAGGNSGSGLGAARSMGNPSRGAAGSAARAVTGMHGAATVQLGSASGPGGAGAVPAAAIALPRPAVVVGVGEVPGAAPPGEPPGSAAAATAAAALRAVADVQAVMDFASTLVAEVIAMGGLRALRTLPPGALPAWAAWPVRNADFWALLRCMHSEGECTIPGY